MQFVQQNQFVDVIRYLHLDDNINLDVSGTFAKVKPLFNMLNGNCLKNFILERNISIDEYYVPYYVQHG